MPDGIEQAGRACRSAVGHLAALRLYPSGQHGVSQFAQLGDVVPRHRGVTRPVRIVLVVDGHLFVHESRQRERGRTPSTLMRSVVSRLAIVGLRLYPKSRPDEFGSEVHAARTAARRRGSWAVSVLGGRLGCRAVLFGYGGVEGG